MFCSLCEYFNYSNPDKLEGWCKRYNIFTSVAKRCELYKPKNKNQSLISSILWNSIYDAKPNDNEHVIICGGKPNHRYMCEAVYYCDMFLDPIEEYFKFDDVRVWASLPPVDDEWFND